MAIDVSREQDVVRRAREAITKRTGKTPEQLYQEREKRVADAVQLKVPDRVPVCLKVGSFPIRYVGLSQSAKFYDADAHKEAVIKTLVDFEPDVFTNTPADSMSGLALETLGAKQYRWPGGPLRPDEHAQYLDMEIMRANEYDLFVTDPSDFMLRYYLPRAFGSLASLSQLPSFQNLGGHSALVTQSTRFSSPEIVQAFEALFKAGKEQAKFGQWHRELAAVGTPSLSSSGGAGGAPFDMFGDYLRGMRGMMIDMFERPEKMHIAMERMLEWRLARTNPASSEEWGKRRVGGGANHWGSEAFLSKKQFDSFYWPTWKKALLASIELGFVPMPFCEGKVDDRIECFLELPKGKAFVRFDVIDMARAKAILGNHLCIVGGVPASLLWGGSPQEVEDYCKNLIRVCGKGGGYILACGGLEDDAKPANLKAMVDSVKKYGRYD